jgi:hypothetical protein
VQAEINHTLHVILTLMTVGLWVISWIALCIGKIYRPWRCEHCGWHKPEVGVASRPDITANPRSRFPIRPSLAPASLIGIQPSQAQP